MGPQVAIQGIAAFGTCSLALHFKQQAAIWFRLKKKG